MLKVAREAAQAGAVIAKRYFHDLAAADIKVKQSAKGDQGLVTIADIESERAIVATIREHFPDHAFLAEEEHADPQLKDAEHLWIIDPIDGTNNFAAAIPQFSVSVAYYRDGKPSCGVIINPATGTVYHAVQGGGAWVDGQPARANAFATIDEAVVGCGFYYDRGELMRQTLQAMERLFIGNVRGIRRFGAASLDLVHVGTGSFAGYFEYTLSPWDFAAGRLFVEEAGGRVTDCAGGELPLASTSILATNGILHEAILRLVDKNLS